VFFIGGAMPRQVKLKRKSLTARVIGLSARGQLESKQ